MKTALFLTILTTAWSMASCTTPAEEIRRQEVALTEPVSRDVEPVDSSELSDQKKLQEIEVLDFITQPAQPCQKLTVAMQQEQPRYVSNAITFHLGDSLELDKFSTQARQFVPEALRQKQLSPELYQQMLSYDFMHFCEQTNLGQMNPKSRQKKSNLAAPEAWDYTMTHDSQKIGVRVIALRAATMEQVGDDAIEQVLALSAGSLQKAALSVEPDRQWQTSVLFVWTDLPPEELEHLQRIWENLGTTTKGNSVLYAVSVKGGGFMLCEPPTLTGEECKR